MRIAITMRVIEAAGYKESRDAISHDWFDFFSGYGITPLLIPNILDDHASYMKDLGVDALILSGGNDVCLDGGNPEGSDASIVRDKAEKLLLQYAVEQRLPVLGICRGMQLINIFFNGSIIRLGNGSSSHGHVRCNHEIGITDEKFSPLIGNSIIVNSFHNYALKLGNLSRELRAFAVRPEDGVCEGLYHPDLPILGLQWHPERTNPSMEEDKVLIGKLIKEGAFWRNA